MYRSYYPLNGWFGVAWLEGTQHSPSVKRSIEAIERIPGVDVAPLGVKIPANAWELPDVVAFCFAVNVKQPSIEQSTGRKTWADLNWAPARKPFDHQLVAAKKCLIQHGLLLTDVPGLGKTSSAILAAEEVRRRFNRPVLVLGPLFTRETWRREIAETVGFKCDDYFFHAFAGADTRGPTRDTQGAPYLFCHFDIVDTWWSFINQLKPCFSIVDEAHWIKNPRAKRAKAAYVAAATAPYRMVLTGTPILNEPAELWQLLQVVAGPGSFGSLFEFRRRYCGMIHTGTYYENMEPTNVEELQTRIRDVYLRRSIEDAGITLPEFTRDFSKVALPANLRKQHEYTLSKWSKSATALQDLLEALVSGHVSHDVLALIHALRVVTSKAKLQETIDLIDNLWYHQNESVVVFVWMRDTAQQIASQVTDSVVVSGDLQQDERDERVRAFQEHGGVLIATYGALKEGVTLHKARYVILHDLDWVPATMLQAEKRVHRIGQTRATTSIWCVTEDSIDAVLVSAIRQKLQRIESTLDERDSALEFLGVEENSFQQHVQNFIDEWRGWR